MNFRHKITGNIKICHRRSLSISARIVFPIALLLSYMAKAQQENLDVISGWKEFTDATNVLYHHLSGQLFLQLEKRSEEISMIQTADAWKERQKKVRNILDDIVGPFPPQTPLNAKIVRIVQKENFRIEHIVFESQPGFYVTSSLFIPEGLKGTSPAVIYCSGHTEEGYRSSVYQHVILNLVNKKFIVFAFDPIGQGERKEYFDPGTGHSTIGRATLEHSYAGAQAFLTGKSLARYMIFDGIRAVDYLVSRKEVDPERIGITGRSGGGTQSAYIAAFDDRIYAAAPECYITNLTRLIESIGPQDAEQNFYHGVYNGIDHPDLLEVRAPKPGLMITTTNDFFSIQGARETEQEVSKIYKAYGEENNFSRVEDIEGHASTRENREAMYAFFQKHLNNPGNPEDEEVTLLTPVELQVTETGQVSTSFHGETVFNLNAAENEENLNKLEASRKAIKQHNENAVSMAEKLSGYLDPVSISEPVFTGRFQRDGYLVEKYFLRGEGDYVIPYLLMRPTRSNKKALVYLNPGGKKVVAAPKGEIESYVKMGFTVMVPDVPGTGELGGNNFNGDSDFISLDEKVVSYNIWYVAVLSGRSILGLQAGDVTRLIHVLENMPGIDDLYGIANKGLCPLLLHVAAFNPPVSRIALVEPVTSYRSIVMNRFYDPANIYGSVAGAMQAYDLPDLAASLVPRKLLIINPSDQEGQPANQELIGKDYSFIKNVYATDNAAGKIMITRCNTKEEKMNALTEWLK